MQAQEVSERRVIEEILPIKDISSESAREKSIRQGHIGTLHIWWARRPLIACRGVLLASLLRDPGTQAERENIERFLIEFCTWKSSNDTRKIAQARRLILGQNEGKPPRILDCFAGGGSIPFEGLRLGCEVDALDLNPVSVIILLSTLKYPQDYGNSGSVNTMQQSISGQSNVTVPNVLAHDILSWGEWVLQEAATAIGKLYPSISDGIPVTYLWARTLTCSNPSCRAEVPLLRQTLLSSNGETVAIRIGTDRKKKEVNFEIVKGKKLDFDPRVGTMRYGSVECPVCLTPMSGDFLKDEAKKSRMGFKLVAVLTSNNSKKTFRLATPLDEQLYLEAEKVLRELQAKSSESPGIVPDETISRDWPRTVLPPLYGFVKWGQLFNSRQLLALVTFTAKVKEAYAKMLERGLDPDYAKAIVTYLSLGIDKLADRNSALCVWNAARLHTTNTFGRQALPMVWDFAEINPFADVSGNYMDSVRWISDIIVSNLEAWKATPKAKVWQGSATKLPFPNNTFDAIVTDPPYYNAVPYSDLSDFFYVWLKRSVGRLYPSLFATPLTPKSLEIVEQMKHSSLTNRKDKEFFRRELTEAFKEMHRVLKPGGICTVVFAHKTTSAWEVLIGSLVVAGFRVTASWPLHTERPGRLRAHESAVLASSVWLVCRKRPQDAGVASWKNVQAELDHRVKERLDEFLKQDIKGADALLSAIGPALEVYGRYERVEKVTGDAVSVEEFLDKVREVVAHHALTMVLSEQELGKLDSETAFYVLWKWTFEPGARGSTGEQSSQRDESEAADYDSRDRNGSKVMIPFDDALKLARSVGAEPDILIKTRKLLEQEKEYVNLMGPEDRKKIHGLGEIHPDGTPPAIIDMIHRAVNLWANQEYNELDKYLKTSGAATSDTFRRVSQALSNLLPLKSREKQLLDGLLGRHSELVQASETKGAKTLDEYSGVGKQN